MTEGDLRTIFELMGTKIVGGGRNKVAKCPLAPWTHSGGKDRHPSLTATAGSPALFKCWSCQEKGTVRKLAKLYGEYSGNRSAYDYARNVDGGADQVLWGNVKKVKYGDYYKNLNRYYEKKNPKGITEEQLKEFLKLVPKYAVDRGMSKKEILDYEIGFDQKENRMIIPIRDINGILMGVSGRDVTGVQRPKYKHYLGFQKEKVLYGESFIDKTVKECAIVEGFFDVWHLRKMGIKNPLASMGTSLSMDQIKKVLQVGRKVLIFPDYDKSGAGLRFAEDSAEKLAVHGIDVGVVGVTLNPDFVYRIRENNWEPIDFRLRMLDDFIGKDPSDLTAEGMQRVLQNTKRYKIQSGKVCVD